MFEFRTTRTRSIVFGDGLPRWVISKVRILTVDSRAAEGQYDRLPGLAKEIVDLHPDVIVAEATPAIAAVQRATKSIPNRYGALN